jgi:hypothetical protein
MHALGMLEMGTEARQSREWMQATRPRHRYYTALEITQIFVGAGCLPLPLSAGPDSPFLPTGGDANFGVQYFIKSTATHALSVSYSLYQGIVATYILGFSPCPFASIAETFKLSLPTMQSLLESVPGVQKSAGGYKVSPGVFGGGAMEELVLAGAARNRRKRDGLPVGSFVNDTAFESAAMEALTATAGVSCDEESLGDDLAPSFLTLLAKKKEKVTHAAPHSTARRAITVRVVQDTPSVVEQVFVTKDPEHIVSVGTPKTDVQVMSAFEDSQIDARAYQYFRYSKIANPRSAIKQWEVLREFFRQRMCKDNGHEVTVSDVQEANLFVDSGSDDVPLRVLAVWALLALRSLKDDGPMVATHVMAVSFGQLLQSARPTMRHLRSALYGMGDIGWLVIEGVSNPTFAYSL